MDPLTHGVLGAAVSAFSGQTVSLTNPMTIAAIVGSIVPDIDVVIRLFKDDMYYLRHHRGRSHSLPFLILYSFVITFILSFIFKGMNMPLVFLFSFLGATSHTLMDILNSYGAMLFNKKLKFNLLTLYDPFISLISLFLIFYRNQNNITLITSAVLVAVYLYIRYIWKTKACDFVKKYYNILEKDTIITILPSLKTFYKWDYIISSKEESIVGNVNIFSKKINEIKRLNKIDKNLVNVFRSTKLGKCFMDYSPNVHVSHEEKKDTVILNIVDLRFIFKDDFLHNATLVIDKDYNVLEAYAHPYNREKFIPILDVV